MMGFTTLGSDTDSTAHYFHLSERGRGPQYPAWICSAVMEYPGRCLLKPTKASQLTKFKRKERAWGYNAPLVE